MTEAMTPETPDDLEKWAAHRETVAAELRKEPWFENALALADEESAAIARALIAERAAHAETLGRLAIAERSAELRGKANDTLAAERWGEGERRKAAESRADAAEAKAGWLQALLDGRDAFIVAQGLWGAFVDSLPRAALSAEADPSPDFTEALREHDLAMREKVIPQIAEDERQQREAAAKLRRGAEAADQGETVARELRIVFDDPPGPEGGRFVEVENADGRSINAGEWRQRDDGLWELVLTPPCALGAAEARDG